MNGQEKILLDITAFVDNQSLSDEERIYVKEQIDKNPEYAFEYNVQNSIKNLISNRIDRAKTPAYLIDSIVSNTVETQDNSTKNTVIDFAKEFLLTPRYIFSAASVVIVIALIYSIFSNNISSEIKTPNMFTQAEQNFSSIIAGELRPQKLCKSPSEVQEFFKSAGVNYSTIVPVFSEWNIIGAVVSDEQGQKLAHHVYADDSGHLVYVYQVNKAHFSSNKLLDLSPEIFENLMDNKVVKFKSKNHSTFFFKCDSNVFALVSNDDGAKIEENFINNLVQRNTI